MKVSNLLQRIALSKKCQLIVCQAKFQSYDSFCGWSVSKCKYVFQLLKISIDRIHKSMVTKEIGQECHSTFEKLKMKLNERTGYYSLLIFLFNPYSIALCASKVRHYPFPQCSSTHDAKTLHCFVSSLYQLKLLNFLNAVVA